jgi:hypothetical protein
VAAFQKSHGLVPDGILGRRTYGALGIGPAPAPLPRPQDQPVPGPTPPQPVRDTTPPLLTLYFRMPLGGEGGANPLTAVFFPQNFRPDAPLDCIVWLQGHHEGVPTLSIDRYLSGSWKPEFRFREPINETAKNVVLIAPTLGPRSQCPALVRPGGFDMWLSNVIASISVHGPFSGTVPTLRHLILACHSGGGQPMRVIARGTSRYAANLRECWGFDCMYNTPDPTEWPDWARSNPDKRLYVYWASTTAAKSKLLASAGLPNLIVRQSSTNTHDRVPITYWKDRIENFRIAP